MVKRRIIETFGGKMGTGKNSRKCKASKWPKQENKGLKKKFKKATKRRRRR